MHKHGKTNRLAPGAVFSTLRFRLIVIVLLASLPALSLIVYSNIEQRRHDKNEAVTEALSSVRQVASDQMDLVQETRTLLSVLGRTMDFTDARAMTLVFAGLVREHGVYSNLGFAGPDGLLVASALPFSAPLYLGDRTYFRQATDRREFSIGSYQMGKLTKAAGINFGYPVLSKGRLKGVLYAALPIEVLGKKLSAMPLQEGQAVTIIDGSGTVLARHPTDAGWTGKNIKGTGLESLLSKDVPEGSAQIKGLDGIERVYSHIRIELSGDSRIHIVSGIPASIVYAKADSLLLRNAITSSLTTVLVLLLAGFVSDRLVLNSVRELVSMTKEIGAGRRKSRASVDGGCEELNHLARSLNEMADALEAREEESERQMARIARLNRVYAVLSGINSTIIRNAGRDELLKETCRIAVEHGSFALAWAALLDDAGRLYPAAWAGKEKKFMAEVMEGSSNGPATTASRAVTEDRVVISDFEGDTEPWN